MGLERLLVDSSESDAGHGGGEGAAVVVVVLCEDGGSVGGGGELYSGQVATLCPQVSMGVHCERKSSIGRRLYKARTRRGTIKPRIISRKFS